MKPISMPYGLKSLWDKKSSITYSAVESKLLRKSSSVEENAAFLVRWAAELYIAAGVLCLGARPVPHEVPTAEDAATCR